MNYTYPGVQKETKRNLYHILKLTFGQICFCYCHAKLTFFICFDFTCMLKLNFCQNTKICHFTAIT